MLEVYLHSSIRVHGVALNYLSASRILPLPVLPPTRFNRPVRFILVDFITLTIFGEGCRLLSASLGMFLHGYLPLFRSRYFPQCHVLKHSSFTFFPQGERQCTERQEHFTSVYFNLYVFE
jgi:hypothetical protein